VTARAAERPEEVGVGRGRLSPEGSSDSLVAIANALKLGSSLLATLAIAIAMKFLMPRYLESWRSSCTRRGYLLLRALSAGRAH
jgi:hypothetical protein